MDRFLALSPGLAFFVLNGGSCLGGLLGILVGVLASRALGWVVDVTIGASLCFGLPLLIGISIENRIGLNSRRTRMIAVAGLFYLFFIAPISALVVLVAIDSLNVDFLKVILGVFWLPAMATWFYIPGFVAKTLVMAEEGRPVRLRECPGTYLQFLFFPLGVILLQRRMQAVLLQDPAAPTVSPERP